MTRKKQQNSIRLGLMALTILLVAALVFAGAGCKKSDSSASSTGGMPANAPGASLIPGASAGGPPSPGGGLMPPLPGASGGMPPMISGGGAAAPSTGGAAAAPSSVASLASGNEPLEPSRSDPFAPFAMTSLPKPAPVIWYASHTMPACRRYSATERPRLPEAAQAPTARIAGLIWGGKDYAILERIAPDGTTESLVLRPGDIIENEELVAITPKEALLRDVKTGEERHIPIMSLEEWQSLRSQAGAQGTTGAIGMPGMPGMPGMMPMPGMVPGAGAPGMPGGLPIGRGH